MGGVGMRPAASSTEVRPCLLISQRIWLTLALLRFCSGQGGKIDSTKGLEGFSARGRTRVVQLHPLRREQPSSFFMIDCGLTEDISFAGLPHQVASISQNCFGPQRDQGLRVPGTGFQSRRREARLCQGGFPRTCAPPAAGVSCATTTDNAVFLSVARSTPGTPTSATLGAQTTTIPSPGRGPTSPSLEASECVESILQKVHLIPNNGLFFSSIPSWIRWTRFW